MGFGAQIAIKQKDYVRRFEKAGATNPQNAKPLFEVGCDEPPIFERMVAKGVFVSLGDGRFYLDKNKAKEFTRLEFLGAAIVIIIFIIVLYLLNN